MGPRAGLDAVGKLKKKSHYCFCREMNPGLPARSLLSILTARYVINNN